MGVWHGGTEAGMMKNERARRSARRVWRGGLRFRAAARRAEAVEDDDRLTESSATRLIDGRMFHAAKAKTYRVSQSI